MARSDQRAGFFHTTTRLARAILGGLDNRVSPLSGSSTDPPVTRDMQGLLRRHANTFDHIPPSGDTGYRRVIWYLRRALRKFMKPWLRMQTDFNLATQTLLQHLHDDLQTESNARAVAEQRLEQELLALREGQHLLGTQLQQIQQQSQAAQDGLHRDIQHLRQEIETRERDAVNRELGSRGQIAQSGLFFNPPVWVQIQHTGPRLMMVTERILENIFVHSRLPSPPARVIDLGCSESLSAIEMASLGFQVVGVDLRKLPISHPNFQMVQANLASLPFDDESFDVAVSLSTIEHVGLGWYSPEEAGSSDREVIAEVCRVLRPQGRFILTVPFGQRAVTPVHRIYDRAMLDELLEPFVVLERSYGIRNGDTWTLTLDESLASQADGTRRVSAVCLMVAEKRE